MQDSFSLVQPGKGGIEALFFVVFFVFLLLCLFKWSVIEDMKGIRIIVSSLGAKNARLVVILIGLVMSAITFYQVIESSRSLF